MKRYFLLIAMASSLAQDTLSLIRLAHHFDVLKKNNANNPAWVQQFLSYHHACKDAYNALKSNSPVADHVWYRAEIAKTIYTCGFEFFKNKIDSYLPDWSTLALISNKQVTRWQDLSHQWAGKYFFCSRDRVGSYYDQDQAPGGQRFYFQELALSQYRLCNNNNPPYETLLTSPENGIFFFHDWCYGFIDYDEEGAILYDVSDVDTQRIDFSSSLPWNILKTDGTGKASIFFNQGAICLTFWHNNYDTKPEGQIVYQIRRNGEPVDLSLPQNYKSSDIPICLINGSSHFAKYSHAWFSFYAFQFFLKNPMKKAVRDKSWLNRYLFLYFVSSVFLGVIMMYGVKGVYFTLFYQPISFTFKNVCILFSSFSALLLISCVLRGLLIECLF